jgi:sugar phosphate isomerase/epimerase
MQFALSTHLFHGERLARHHLESARAAGFTDLEIFATRTHFDYASEAAVAEYAALLRDVGLTVGSMHAPICASFVGGHWGRAFSNAASDSARRQEAVDEAKRALAACQLLGASLLVVHLGLPRGQTIPPGDNDRRAAARSLEQIAGAAITARVALALELIPNDLSTPSALLDWLDELEVGGTGVCLDVGHAHVMGDAPEIVEALSGHVLTTHLHDNRKVNDDHLVPFAGTVDWATTLAALWKIGYTGRLVFEVADHGDAAGVLQRTVSARARLQGILNDLAEPFDFGREP